MQNRMIQALLKACIQIQVVCFLLSLSFWGPITYGQNEVNERVEEKVVAESTFQTQGILWFGFEGGPIILSSLNENQELSKDGYSLGLKSSYSYLTDMASFDITAGWLMTVLEVNSQEKAPLVVEEDPSEIPAGVKVTQVKTRLGFAGFSIRFRLHERIELGPTAVILFGSDSSFSPEKEPTSTTPNVLLGVNAALLAKMPSPDSLFAFRIFGQYLRDVSIEDRNVDLISAGLDFGFGFAKEKPKVIVKNRYRTRYKTKVKYKTKIKRDVKVVAKVKENYLVDAGIVNFETAKHDLKPNIQMYLRQLTSFLRSRQADWEQITLISHTDRRGGFAYNEGLSKRRARAIELVLLQNGIPPARIEVRSKAFLDPVDDKHNSVALAKNRRVEILIEGGPRTYSLKQEIIKLQQKYRMPSTCKGADCR